MADFDNDDLDAALAELPDKLEQELAGEFADAVDEYLIEPIRDAAAQGPSGRLKASVRKEPGEDDFEWIVMAGGPLTTKIIGQRGYRREIDISSGDTQGVARGNAPVVYDYALGKEFGNSHMPADPFFYSTYRVQQGPFEERVAEIVADALDRIGG